MTSSEGERETERDSFIIVLSKTLVYIKTIY